MLGIVSTRKIRISKEIKNFNTKPPWGIVCYPCEDENYGLLNISMRGPTGTPYENGTFKLEVTIPERYPFEPPFIKFVTPVYHPNIDNGGRVCMDMLRIPPNGTWMPTITLEMLLISLQSLLANPNPGDPLMMDIAFEFTRYYDKFIENARKHTEKHAML